MDWRLSCRRLSPDEKSRPLIFLTPLGASVRYFDPFAAKFTDHFHVMGFTRRGQGLSENAPSGYDTA
jgi:pimeloyl-ACP methyl ester carboxylesterase